MQENAFDQLKENNYGDFAAFMSGFQAGNWVYPALIHNKLQMDAPTVYKLLEFLASKNYLTPYLELYCPNCKHNFYYKTLGELPRKINCENCNHEIANPINHTVVIYQVN